MIASLSRWLFGAADVKGRDLFPGQLDRFAACKDVPEIKPPRVIYADHAQRELRHAPPTVCGKCGDLTGYNDGVQPCNACFVAGMEAAHDAIRAQASKVRPFQTRGVAK